MELIHQRVMCLTGWLLDRLTSLRHGNGRPMALIYGPDGTQGRGGTVAFNFLDTQGAVIDERAVARDADAPRYRSRRAWPGPAAAAGPRSAACAAAAGRDG